MNASLAESAIQGMFGPSHQPARPIRFVAPPEPEPYQVVLVDSETGERRAFEMQNYRRDVCVNTLSQVVTSRPRGKR